MSTNMLETIASPPVRYRQLQRVDKDHAETLVRSCHLPSTSGRVSKNLSDLGLLQSALTAAPLVLTDVITLWALLLGSSTFVERLCRLPHNFITRDTALVASLLLVPIVKLAGLYPALGTSSVVEFRQIVRSAATSLCIFLGVGIVSQPSSAVYYAAAAFLTFLLAIPILPAARFTTRCFASWSSWWGAPVLIYAKAKTAEELFLRLRVMKDRGLRPAAVLLSSEDYWLHAKRLEEQGIPACDVRNGLQCALEHRATWVLIEQVAGNERRTAISRDIDGELNAIPNRVLMSAGSFDCGLWDSTHTIGPVCGLWLSTSRYCGYRALLKRTVDVIVTLTVLLIASPVLLAIAAAIRLSSPGPIFYSQNRVGKGGRTFSAYKFRSMVLNADAVLQQYLDSDPQLRSEWESTHKLKHDPRVTWIGRLIRATSLDELPQLWNILNGDMSLVGPRPLIDSPKYDAIYINDYPHEFAAYSSMRPGLTGLWQVTCRNSGVYEMRIYLDMYYIRNWSLWLDLYIILRTIRTVLLREGAY